MFYSHPASKSCAWPCSSLEEREEVQSAWLAVEARCPGTPGQALTRLVLGSLVKPSWVLLLASARYTQIKQEGRMLPEAVWISTPPLSVQFASGVPAVPDFRLAKRMCARCSQFCLPNTFIRPQCGTGTEELKLFGLTSKCLRCQCHFVLQKNNDGSFRPRMMRGFLDAKMWHSPHWSAGGSSAF